MVQVVFRVLYKKTYTLGVPMPVIVGEIFLAVILMLAFGWYWFALICIAFHIALASLLGKTFSSLPEKLRDTFLQSRYEGLTNKEIAIKEKISIKAIEYRISAVLRSFKKITNTI